MDAHARRSADAVSGQLARWADSIEVPAARRLANRLGEVHHAADQVRALIESLNADNDIEASARTLRRIRGWLVDELADLAGQLPQLLDPISSALFDRLPDTPGQAGDLEA